MKKLLLSTALLLFLTACGPPEAGFSEVDTLPNDVQEFMSDLPDEFPHTTVTEMRLLSFNDGENGSYIVFHSSGQVEAHTESEGGTLVIHLTETDIADAPVTQYTYYLTTGPEHDTIDVRVNDEPIPFDMAISL
jgi:hypothetical protein